MAWNPSPKIADLRELSRKWGYNEIVVLAIDSKTGDYMTVSYGKTRKLCKETDKIRDQIHREVADGNIET